MTSPAAYAAATATTRLLNQPGSSHNGQSRIVRGQPQARRIRPALKRSSVTVRVQMATYASGGRSQDVTVLIHLVMELRDRQPISFLITLRDALQVVANGNISDIKEETVAEPSGTRPGRCGMRDDSW